MWPQKSTQQMEPAAGDDEALDVIQLAENKLQDLGIPFAAAAPLASAPALCAAICAARSCLGGLGDVPPLPAAATLADAQHFAASLGFPYALTGAEADRLAAVLDFLASELQALRFALSAQRREARAADAVARSASLETELHSLLRALSIPPLRGDVASTHPDKVLLQVSEAASGARARRRPAAA